MSSLFVLSELLAGQTEERTESFVAAAYRRAFRSSQLLLLGYDERATELYARIRKVARVTPMDALHLATAAAAGVDLFVTEDVKLQSLVIPGAGRIMGLAEAQLLVSK